TYTTAGKYLPKLIFSDGAGCQSASAGQDTIIVDDIEAGFDLSPYPACLGTPMTFTDTSKSAYSNLMNSKWIFHDNSTSSGGTTSRTYTTVGNFDLTLISTNVRGCKDTILKTIEVHGLPQVTALGDTIICIGDKASLSANGASTYVWSPAGPDLSCTNCTQTFASPTTNTLYTVTGTDDFGCVATDTVRVNTKIKTEFNVVPADTIC